jgi:hypothetical protein
LAHPLEAQAELDDLAEVEVEAGGNTQFAVEVADNGTGICNLKVEPTGAIAHGVPSENAAPH